jgi:O-antigen/teichoic acid export membrane protein
VLAKLSTLHELGLYAVANGATGVLALAAGGLGQAWVPHSIQVYEEHPGVAPSLFGRMLTYILVGFGLLSVGITAFAHEALVLLSTAPFYRAATAIGPLALAFMAWASTQVTSLGITLRKKTTHLALISGVAALLNLGLNLWLVPIWGMLASAWATTASYVFLTLAYLITSRRLYRVTYETRRAVAIVAGTVAFVVAAPLLPEIGLAGGFALKTSYCLAYVVVLFALGGVDWRERNALRRMWDRRRSPPAAT